MARARKYILIDTRCEACGRFPIPCKGKEEASLCIGFADKKVKTKSQDKPSAGVQSEGTVSAGVQSEGTVSKCEGDNGADKPLLGFDLRNKDAPKNNSICDDCRFEFDNICKNTWKVGLYMVKDCKFYKRRCNAV